ncbi:UDP-N-acetylmuramoyl-L-alanyl-D-glutamate--2,6-diaminopimelate ligase [Arcanobacterium ihumii]|uniref:UDP-N-acetylmuramoyl-L-alanyl-D-glutamate--2, 6-diaminopimelate ligase n=1 Tax=Arcanobacterium ihumii TaxID=2138162 RepID=UPI000F526392|nr:UDP-N-acetylmuramoyl-L-alanyl-D-glutamate--2,6-diaminopimelate ligase [Arcanobacterium ihumii]
MIRPELSPRIALDAVVDFLDATFHNSSQNGAQSSADIVVTGVALGSKEVQPGDLFVAVPGERVHGAKFAGNAQENGACAVITDSAGRELIKASEGLAIPIVVCEDILQRQGDLAALIYGYPSQGIASFGITGTNGKTTTSYMIDSILGALGKRMGLVGTVMVRAGSEEIPALMTTPQAVELQAMLAKMREYSIDALVMEVSSHALAQNRTRPIHFNVAGFTNLTQDHLDFHKTFDEYFAAKKLLFSTENSGSCVITVDDEYGRQLYSQTKAERGQDCVALAIHSELPSDGGWKVQDFHVEATGSSFTLVSPRGESISVQLDIPGEFNVQNAALAIAMVAQSGVELDEISQALLSIGGLKPKVPGRMEIVATMPRVIVDFAHNPDALKQAIKTLRLTTKGRLVTLTGSAGDRDRTKRPIMGNIVASLADLTIITDDDPHSEDPARIRAEIIEGIATDAEFIEIGDRTEAIHYAIANAEPQDTILIAGRGHEIWQDCNGTMVELDDRVVARDALGQRNMHAQNALLAKNDLLGKED